MALMFNTTEVLVFILILKSNIDNGGFLTTKLRSVAGLVIQASGRLYTVEGDTSTRLGLRIVKELNLKLILGMNDWRKELSFCLIYMGSGSAVQITVRPNVKNPLGIWLFIVQLILAIGHRFRS